MLKILITSGPTREYLDPVRYLTNGSSGRMGAALAEAVVQRGAMPIVVSGQVKVAYPPEAQVHWVGTTEEMLDRCLEWFPHCAGVIGAAAPCDFKPATFSERKIAKEKEEEISFRFLKTPDILAALGKIKRPEQWSVAFALETHDGKARALEKMKQKCCDFVVLNDPNTINSEKASFQVFDAAGEQRKQFTGTKRSFAEELVRLIFTELML